MSNYRVRYQTIEFGDTDIHVRSLRDNQEFSDDFGIAEKLGISSSTWSLFGILWDSGLVLAHHMHTASTEGKRILELGCGIGLASLVLNRRNQDITATDYHPEAHAFLNKNTALNSDAEIPFLRTGWADEKSELGLFDIIIGSDILYDNYHAELVSEFIEQHAKPHCQVIIVDPGRKQTGRFSKEMVKRGYTFESHKPENCEYINGEYKGKIWSFTRV
ncbi:class I SAM-dependent methyltransferase [Saccharophagus degradans]|uniref:Histidine kinase n=1 Tax=Saccharophagus degradans (strain 2-40 / ATCC 43961 / DSM 17024) TaxID=203122 RepID=Q21GS4_SACD2|nr:methyltransferase [Saccharophagus degradans]ABD82105.1 histidine kinase [Saccharophagus degradans 2-40]